MLCDPLWPRPPLGRSRPRVLDITDGNFSGFFRAPPGTPRHARPHPAAPAPRHGPGDARVDGFDQLRETLESGRGAVITLPHMG
ncbi:hypothetical protein ACWC5I_30780, partial [Kitasatospora sp. NPDC001574]